MALRTLQQIRGDTWKRTWVLKDANGVPLDLSGCRARLQVRDRDGLLRAEASTTAGRLILTPLAGRIDMVMPADAMGLTPGAYRFDLEVVFLDGTVTTYETAQLNLLEDVTHD